jgi:hypothetical protein
MGVNIIPDFWDQSLRPGMHIGVDTSSCAPPSAEQPPVTANPDENSSTNKSYDSAVDSEKNELKHAITYTIDIRQMSEDGKSETPLGLRHATEPPVFKRFQWDPSEMQDTKQAVMQEIFRFSMSHKKSKDLLDLESRTFQYDDDDRISQPTLHIHSKILLNALKATIKFENKKRADEHDITSLEHGIFAFPYADLYHNLGGIVSYKGSDHPSRALHDETYNKICDEQIDLLEGFLRNHPRTGFKEAETSWTKSTPTTTCKNLWLLFQPGMDVYLREWGHINMYVVKRVVMPGFSDGNLAGANGLTLKLWNLDHAQGVFGRTRKVHYIARFLEEREITSLTCYPRRFHVDKEGQTPLRDRLIERGKKVVNYVRNGSTYQKYTGDRYIQIGHVRPPKTARPLITNLTVVASSQSYYR